MSGSCRPTPSAKPTLTTNKNLSSHKSADICRAVFHGRQRSFQTWLIIFLVGRRNPALWHFTKCRRIRQTMTLINFRLYEVQATLWDPADKRYRIETRKEKKKKLSNWPSSAARANRNWAIKIDHGSVNIGPIFLRCFLSADGVHLFNMQWRGWPLKRPSPYVLPRWILSCCFKSGYA